MSVQKTLYVDSDDCVSQVSLSGNTASVTYLNFDRNLDTLQLTDTGNGFIALFHAVHSTQQDYYVCLDYSQARDLVLGLAEFKQELGFTK